MKIIIASNNEHKINEIKQAITVSVSLISMKQAGVIEDIPENEETLEGNALLKARYVHSLTGENVIADDTGLEVEALNGQPGVHSARYAGESKDSEDNIKKLLIRLEKFDNRRARFRTVIAFIYSNEEYLFEGIANGRIISEKRGVGGFGYDPVFIPDGYSQTFAEMLSEEKNLISHRGLAVVKLCEFINNKIAQ